MADTLIIILSIIGLAVLLIIIFAILKFLKGSVKLMLDKKSFSSSELITGKVNLKAKKQINSNRLYVVLEAMREERRRSPNGGRNTTWTKVYSQEVNLAESGTYPPGHNASYDFSIKVPTSKEVGKFSSGNKMIDSTINFASSVLGVGRFKWSVRAILDAKGIDLSSKKRIYVNLSDNSVLAPTTV